MIEAAIYDLLNESIKIKQLLTQPETIEYFDRTATYDNRFTKQNSCYSFGNGPKTCLLYTSSETGTTIGGTAMTVLTNLLQRGTCNFRHLPVTWHFAPNIADTEQLIKSLNPDFVFQMTGTLAASKDSGVTFTVRHPLPDKHSNMIRSMYLKSGLRINPVNNDPQMGEGFRVISTEKAELTESMPAKCQFLSIESDYNENTAPADQVFLLMASGLVVIDSL